MKWTVNRSLRSQVRNYNRATNAPRDFRPRLLRNLFIDRCLASMSYHGLCTVWGRRGRQAGRRMFASSGRARFRVSVLLLVRFLSSPRITAAYQCQGGSTSALRVCACVCISYIVCWNTNRVWKRDVDDVRDRCDRLAIFPISRGRARYYIWRDVFFFFFFFYTIDNIRRLGIYTNIGSA